MQSNTAVITGANRGLGFEIAKLLFNEGIRIISLSRKKPDIDCDHYFCDLSDELSVKQAIHSITTKYEKIDIFINNAAVFLEKEFIDISEQEWSYVNKVNLHSPILLTKSLIQLMMNNEFGKIINISSTAALAGKAKQSAYCLTKHALLGMFRSLNQELKEHNIHIYNVCPGGINTDFTKGTEVFEELRGQNLIDKKQIADVVYFLIKQSDNIEISEIVINRYKKN